jgi:hypothetical protein
MGVGLDPGGDLDLDNLGHNAAFRIMQAGVRGVTPDWEKRAGSSRPDAVRYALPFRERYEAAMAGGKS